MTFNVNVISKKNAEAKIKRDRVALLRKTAAALSVEELLARYSTGLHGLSPEQVEENREIHGENRINNDQKQNWISRCVEAFVNPFTIVLSGLALISFVTDVVMAPPGEAKPMTVLIIVAMVTISGGLRLVQETRSSKAADALRKMIRTTTCVERQESGKQEIDLGDVVVGDLVYLSAGDMIPADMRIIAAKDLFISQSSLTGESEPVEKQCSPIDSAHLNALACDNLAFLGSNVISGTAMGIVIGTGDTTLFGEIASSLNRKTEATRFEKGVNDVSWVLIRFMVIMVPIVFVINGMTKSWLEALLFAVSIAVGLTPEMLPMIVTTSLAKGALAMSKEKTIIKNLNAIQNLGSMTVLCTDKTGTLTQDRVVLEYHLNIEGQEDIRVLKHAFLNSYFQTGLKNLMDHAIIERTQKDNVLFQDNYQKVDEVPFDFERRRMSVVVRDQNGKTQMITKGAIEEMLSICSFVEYQGDVSVLTEARKAYILAKVDQLNGEGLRVLGIAQKSNPSGIGAFGIADENEMVLMGYLAFLDPPKASAAAAIRALNHYGVQVRVLTGDNDKVTRSICRQVGIESDHILLGEQIDQMGDDLLKAQFKQVNVYAKLSPAQKERLVTLMRDDQETVGFLGDGINDAPAMKAADVGISVDSAVDIAKESADVILLEKNLMVLENGILEGRKTYANMIKYIKMTASSNFGNMLSVLIASAFLPFLPMMSVQILLLNLIYDVTCTAIPWDNVDEEFLAVPRKWEAKSISSFMLWIGPTSSVFDVLTFILMYFVVCPALCGGMFHQLSAQGQVLFIALFQTGWFIESMWSQTLVIHMIRTPKIPFLQSRASKPVLLLGSLGILGLSIIPYTGLGAHLGFAPLPAYYFLYLGVIILLYMGLATLMKKRYIAQYGNLL